VIFVVHGIDGDVLVLIEN